MAERTTGGAHRSRYESCLDVCGNLDNPGVALDALDTIDFSRRETTKDQARIEAELERMDLAGKIILHVGVGNSKLAERFASRVKLIDGLTIAPPEKARADSLGLPNYRVRLGNKYSRALRLQNRYDFIIDNNLAGFVCCKYHFHLMWNTYLDALRPGGKILTHQRGMDWTFADPRWRLGYDDLVALEAKLPVKVSRLTEAVYAIGKAEPAPEARLHIRSQRRRAGTARPVRRSAGPQ